MYDKRLDFLGLEFMFKEMLENSVIVRRAMIVYVQSVVGDHVNKNSLIPPLRVRICLKKFFVISPFLKKHVSIIGVFDNKNTSIQIPVSQILTEQKIWDWI
jgi:hypothetical protein